MDIAVILIVVVIGTNKIVIKIEYFLIKFKGVQKMNNNDDVGIDELLKNVDLGKIQDNSNTKIKKHSIIECKFLKWWSQPGLNRRHMDFQSIALPTELQDHLVAREGFEPTTSGL